jgi:hypothetical protein
VPETPPQEDPSVTPEQRKVVQQILKATCFYEVMGVSKDASDTDIKSAYKKVGSEAPASSGGVGGGGGEGERRRVVCVLRVGMHPNLQQTSHGHARGGCCDTGVTPNFTASHLSSRDILTRPVKSFAQANPPPTHPPNPHNIPSPLSPQLAPHMNAVFGIQGS